MDPNLPETERRMKAFMETCRRAGLRVTPQRMEVFRQVAGTDEHPDAETIHRRIRQHMPNVSLDTIYRVLYVLEDEGLLSRVRVLTDRLRFDANMRHHHHFVCTKCSRIRDFYSEELDACKAPEELKSWGQVQSIDMQVRGVCAECLRDDRHPSDA